MPTPQRPSASGNSVETEIKLAMDAEALRPLPRLPIIAAHSLYRPVTRRLRSTYFDTDQLALQERGVAVRLRQAGRRSLQTIKLAGSSAGGLHQRREWETHTPLNTLDFSVIDDVELRDWLERVDLRRDLRPVFETDFRRTQRLLRIGDDEIELAIDRGEVRTPSRAEPICEVELELKSGDVARLFEIAQALNKALPLRVEPRSKAERGYRLFTAAQDGPCKAEAPELAPDLSANAAFVRVANSCLAQLQANELGLLRSDDIEYVHQMRVALRRLRSAISVFRGLIPKQASETVVAPLRWLAGELNDARNWDVFIEEALPTILQANSAEAALTWLQQQAQAEQQSSRQRARAAVGSARYRSMLLSVGQWLATHAWTAAAPPEALALSARELAEMTLAERHKRLRKRGKDLANLTTEERHALRIAAKKLRYAAEFFSSIFSKREVQAYVGALAKLQDVLGRLNDAATTSELLDKLAAQATAATEHGVLGYVRGWMASHAVRTAQRLEPVWREFKQVQRFW